MTMLHSAVAARGLNIMVGVQEVLDFFNEPIRIAGFDDNAIETGFASMVQLPQMRIARRGNEWDVPSLGICAQLPGYIEAGNARQFEVENNQIGQQSLSLLQRFGTVSGRGDAIPQ